VRLGFLDCRIELGRGRNIVDGDIEARLRKTKGDRLADAAAGAGDESDRTNISHGKDHWDADPKRLTLGPE
jgi:hypothetical protein